MAAWRVNYDHGTAWVHGPKTEAQRRLIACGDNPVWSRPFECWAASPEAASKLLDQLDARRIEYVVENADQAALDHTETEPANVGGGLW